MKPQDLSIFTGKTVVSFTGNFGPPHRGHFGTVKEAIEEVSPDIVVISTMNSENPTNSRHGVPKMFTLWAWEEWGKILEKKYGVITYVCSDFIDLWLFAKPRKVITIEVIETDFQDPSKPIELGLREQSRVGLSSAFWKHAKELMIFTLKRDDASGLSSTKFVKLLRQMPTDIGDLFRFLPDELSPEEKLDYMFKISEYEAYFK